MKPYPTIPKLPDYTTPILAFDKLDGSCIRVELNKKGMYKFGSRTQLIDSSSPVFGKVLDMARQFEDAAMAVLKNAKVDRAMLFFEFHGPKSFAGSHDPEDDHVLTLFDATLGTKGFLAPDEFLSRFEGFPTPSVLFRGKVTPEFEESVRDGSLPGMTFEGVVCKGPSKQPGRNLTFKIKNQAWIAALRKQCQTEEEFERLA